MNAIETAVKLAGGQSALGRAIGKRQSSVREWLLPGGRVPAEMCGPISAATGGRVTVQHLRPDVFGHPDRPLPEPSSDGEVAA